MLIKHSDLKQIILEILKEDNPYRGLFDKGPERKEYIVHDPDVAIKILRHQFPKVIWTDSPSQYVIHGSPRDKELRENYKAKIFIKYYENQGYEAIMGTKNRIDRNIDKSPEKAFKGLVDKIWNIDISEPINLSNIDKNKRTESQTEKLKKLTQILKYKQLVKHFLS